MRSRKVCQLSGVLIGRAKVFVILVSHWLSSACRLLRSMAPKSFTCGVDLCTMGEHFCDTSYRICRRCLDYRSSCFTKLHQPNCTRACKDALENELESQVIDKLRVRSCLPIPELENGQHNGSAGNISYGEMVEFGCNSDYRLIGAKNIACGEFGTWSTGPPLCDLKADVSCVSNENILIGVTIALVILLVLTNIPNAVRIYNYLRAKFRKDTDPNNEGSSYSSEAEMKLLDDPEASSRHEPVPNDPVVVNDRMQPGPGAQPHHHSAPNIPPADIAQIPYQRPQPGGLPQPHSSGHDPDVPYSGSYSLPHEFNDDKEQTRVLTPYPPAQSGKDVRWQRQPSTSYGNYRRPTSATGTPLPVEETEKGAAAIIHIGRHPPRNRDNREQHAKERCPEDIDAGGQSAWERAGEEDHEGEHHSRENASCHGQETEPTGRKMALDNGTIVDRNDIVKKQN